MSIPQMTSVTERLRAHDVGRWRAFSLSVVQAPGRTDRPSWGNVIPLDDLRQMMPKIIACHDARQMRTKPNCAPK